MSDLSNSDIKDQFNRLKDEREDLLETMSRGNDDLFFRVFNKEKFQDDYEKIILPLRDTFITDWDIKTIPEFLLLDLILITYYKIMKIEGKYFGLELFLENQNMDKFIKDKTNIMYKLHKQLTILLETLIRLKGGYELKINAQNLQVGNQQIVFEKGPGQ